MSNKKEQWGNIELPGLSDEELLAKNWNHVAGIEIRNQNGWYEKNNARNKDPEYRKKFLESMSKLSENTEWLEKQKTRYDDPEYLEKFKQANKKRFEDPEVREKIANANKKKSANPEVRKKISDTIKNQLDDPKFKFKRVSKPCITPYGIFVSIREAGKFEEQLTGKKFNPNAWTHKLKDPNSGYKRITKEEYILLTGKEL